MLEEDGGADPAAIAALAARLAAIGAAEGSYAPLGAHHAALHCKGDGEVLLVTCERFDEIAARDENALPFGLTLAEMHGWSLLSLLADGETGWRDPLVWHYLDDLSDRGFFDDFDRVVFYGAGLAGYAAAAFSVAAPGATVLMLSPRATLSTDRAAWDRRHPGLRRTDFTSRYGYAPRMLDAAGEALLVHDPWQTADAMHAALFADSPAIRLGWRGLGSDPETRLGSMGVLVPLIALAAEGRLSAANASRLWRARRASVPWLRDFLAQTEASRKPIRALRLCRLIVARHPAPRFQLKLMDLEAAARS